MQNINGNGAILHELGLLRGEMSARFDGIEARQDRESIKLDSVYLKVDRLEHDRPSAPRPPAIWQTDKFWLAVAGAGASLAGMPELAKLLIPH